MFVNTLWLYLIECCMECVGVSNEGMTTLASALLKATYSSKRRHFIIQERFNKLIYGINTIIKCGTR